METLHFNKLLLKTAFSCMACDGDIDKREVKLIKQLQKERKTFGEIDINAELDTLLLAINKDGQQFLKDYFNELTTTELTEANELKLIEVAIDTIKADDKVSSVSVASIIAKYFKDLEMENLHELRPEYNFIKNSGYGTKEHIQKIREFGYTEYHRMTFKIKELV